MTTHKPHFEQQKPAAQGGLHVSLLLLVDGPAQWRAVSPQL